MRTQTEGSVVTAVVKREFQTHKKITRSFAYIHFLETTVKFKLNGLTAEYPATYLHVIE